MENKNRRLKKTVLIVGAVFFMIPNILFAVQGFSVRYWADDYCFSGFIKKFGFVRGLAEFYSSTSNRFSAFIFVGFSEMFGENTIRMIPPLIIIFLGFILWKIIYKLLDKFGNEQSRELSVLLSQILLFFVLYLAPNIHQSVYWRSGLSHYFLSLPVLLFSLNMIFFPGKLLENRFIEVILLFIISFFNAGLSESYAALQMGVFGTAFFFILIWNKSGQKLRRLRLIASTIIGTAAAMGVMTISPGNALRLDTLQQASNLYSIFSISTSSATDFVVLSIRGLWLPFCILFGSFVLITFNFIHLPGYEISVKRLMVSFLLLVLFILALIICVCAPTAFGMMAYPEKRVLMLAQFILICGVSLEGVVFGLLIQKFLYSYSPIRVSSLFFILVFCSYPLSTLDVRRSDLNFYNNRAELWDMRQVEINNKLNEGQKNLSVTALDSFAEIAELGDDANYWVNQCASRYYGVESISAVEK